MASVLLMFTRSFHLVKYLCNMVIACVSRRAMVSFLQDCVRMAVSSAYNANCVLGGCGMSEIKITKRVVDKTAPCGRLVGVEDASFR
jgi:hypothetical protein